MSEQTDKENNLNKWLAGLVGAIIVWTIGVLFYIDNKIEPKSPPINTIILVDKETGKIINPAYTNLFLPQFVKSSNTNKSTQNSINRKPAFEHKDTYSVEEFVIINYFYVEGIVVEKSGDLYTVMYKDHNHTLQKVTVTKELLLSPTSYISPVSLLVD